MTAGWAPWNAGSGGFRIPSVTGEYAEGQSLHYTYTAGASFEFSFHGAFCLSPFSRVQIALTRSNHAGTAVYLFGSANCTYDVSIDSGSGGAGLTSDTNLLFAKSGLPPGTHFVNVTVHATEDGQFAFDSAIVTDALPSGCAFPAIPTITARG